MIRPRPTSVLTTFKFWRGDALVAHMAGHLLALEDLAGILALAGRAGNAVRQRIAVGGAAAAEIVALHDALEALAHRRAGDVDELADQEMIGGDLGADLDQIVGAHPELDHLALRLDLGLGEMPAQGIGRVLDLAQADTELDGGIAVLLGGALRDHLAIVELEHGHPDLLARIGEDAGHAQLLCDHSGTHSRFGNP